MLNGDADGLLQITQSRRRLCYYSSAQIRISMFVRTVMALRSIKDLKKKRVGGRWISESIASRI